MSLQNVVLRQEGTDGGGNRGKNIFALDFIVLDNFRVYAFKTLTFQFSTISLFTTMFLCFFDLAGITLEILS